jgi:hypothetical protein
MDLLAPRTINEHDEYKNYYVNGVDQGAAVVDTKTTYHWFLLQKIANVALGALAFAGLVPFTPIVAPLSFGSVLAVVG